MNRQTDAPPLTQDTGQPSGQSSARSISVRSRREERQLALTGRDEDILAALALKIRCLNASLIAGAWWSGLGKGEAATRQRLRQLTKSGWLCAVSKFARPLPPLTAPIVVWAPGDPVPAFGPISYFLKHRFTQPARATQIVFASSKAMKRFAGGKVRCPRSSEVSHDLGLAAVYLRLLIQHPHRATAWISEGKILAHGTSAGVKVPDALIVGANARKTAIEFGGEYGKAKLVQFHEYCEATRLEYELW